MLAGSMLLTTLAIASTAQAGVVLSSTRVVYPAQDREVTLKLDNRNAHPTLVQTWIDDGDAAAAPEDANVPFVITPPVFRIEPGKSQTLRITHTGGAMPTDRESLYWLNSLEVPPKPSIGGEEAQNYMQLAFRTRIKLFYRPKNLPYPVEQARAKLKVTLMHQGGKWAVAIDNPTPYYMNFSEIGIKVGDKTYGKGIGLKGGGGMVAPQSNSEFPIEDFTGATSGAKPLLLLIDDYGAMRELDSSFTP